MRLYMPPSAPERTEWLRTPDECRIHRNLFLNFRETLEVCLQNVAAQCVVDEFAFALSVDQASVFKLFHVMRERCGADRETVSDIAAGTGGIASADLLEDLVAARICQRAGNESKLAICKSHALYHLTFTVTDVSHCLIGCLVSKRKAHLFGMRL